MEKMDSSREPSAEAPAAKRTKMEGEVMKRAPVGKYLRGHRASSKKLKDKKLRVTLKRIEDGFEVAARQAARREVFLPEEGGFLEAEGMERSYKFQQEEIC